MIIASLEPSSTAGISNQPTVPPTTERNSSTVVSQLSNGSASTSTALIGGVVAGAILLLVLIGGLGYYYYNKNKNRDKSTAFERWTTVYKDTVLSHPSSSFRMTKQGAAADDPATMSGANPEVYDAEMADNYESSFDLDALSKPKQPTGGGDSHLRRVSALLDYSGMYGSASKAPNPSTELVSSSDGLPKHDSASEGLPAMTVPASGKWWHLFNGAASRGSSPEQSAGVAGGDNSRRGSLIEAQNPLHAPKAPESSTVKDQTRLFGITANTSIGYRSSPDGVAIEAQSHRIPSLAASGIGVSTRIYRNPSGFQAKNALSKVHSSRRLPPGKQRTTSEDNASL
jgi:hypothetical protein